MFGGTEHEMPDLVRQHAAGDPAENLVVHGVRPLRLDSAEHACTARQRDHLGHVERDLRNGQAVRAESDGAEGAWTVGGHIGGGDDQRCVAAVTTGCLRGAYLDAVRPPDTRGFGEGGRANGRRQRRRRGEGDGEVKQRREQHSCMLGSGTSMT